MAKKAKARRWLGVQYAVKIKEEDHGLPVWGQSRSNRTARIIAAKNGWRQRNDRAIGRQMNFDAAALVQTYKGSTPIQARHSAEGLCCCRL